MKKIFLTLLVGILLLSMVACSTTTNPMNTPSSVPSAMPTAMPTDPNMPGAGTNGTGNPNDAGMPAANPAAGTVSPAPVAMTTQENFAMAQKVGVEVGKLSEIAECSVAIMGNNAIVGVTFDKQYKGEMTHRIKDMVSERVKVVMPHVQQVAVTADPDLRTRIATLDEKFKADRPVSEISGEFKEVFQRIHPAV